MTKQTKKLKKKNPAHKSLELYYVNHFSEAHCPALYSVHFINLLKNQKSIYRKLEQFIIHAS